MLSCKNPGNMVCTRWSGTLRHNIQIKSGVKKVLLKESVSGRSFLGLKKMLKVAFHKGMGKVAFKR